MVYGIPGRTSSVAGQPDVGRVSRRHPYLNFYQSRVIVGHRRKYGPIKKLQALSLYEEFTPSDLERLQPYVSFEE